MTEVNIAKEMNISEETVCTLIEQISGFPRWELKHKKNITVLHRNNIESIIDVIIIHKLLIMI